MHTVLIIEDERDLADLVAFNLERVGYQTVIARDGMEGMTAANRMIPELILLDQMLPGMPGTEVCKHLKRSDMTARIPIIMMSARSEEIDRVIGFEAGVDDYVAKPFSTWELLLRVKAILRRTTNDCVGGSIIKVGPLAIDSDRHLVAVNGDEVECTSTEFKLLHALAQRTGRVQSREVLLRDVWGYHHVDDSRTVDTHITRLRTKMGAAGDIIKTVRGAGYKIESL